MAAINTTVHRELSNASTLSNPEQQSLPSPLKTDPLTNDSSQSRVVSFQARSIRKCGIEGESRQEASAKKTSDVTKPLQKKDSYTLKLIEGYIELKLIEGYIEGPKKHVEFFQDDQTEKIASAKISAPKYIYFRKIEPLLKKEQLQHNQELEYRELQHHQDQDRTRNRVAIIATKKFDTQNILNPNYLKYTNPAHLMKIGLSLGILKNDSLVELSQDAINSKHQLLTTILRENEIFMNAHSNNIILQPPMNPTRKYLEESRKVLMGKMHNAINVKGGLFTNRRAGAYAHLSGANTALGVTVSNLPYEEGSTVAKTIGYAAGRYVPQAGGIATCIADAVITQKHDEHVSKQGDVILNFVLKSGIPHYTVEKAAEELSILLTLNRKQSLEALRKELNNSLNVEQIAILDTTTAIQIMQNGTKVPGDVEGVAVAAINESTKKMVHEYLEKVRLEELNKSRRIRAM